MEHNHYQDHEPVERYFTALANNENGAVVDALKNALLEFIFLHFRGYLHSVARSRIRQGTLCEDEDGIVSSVFIKVVEHIDQYNGTDPLKAWLVGITNNVVIDCVRRSKVRRYQDHVPVSACDHGLVSQCQQVGNVILLSEIKAVLKPRDYDMLYACYALEETYDEVTHFTKKRTRAAVKSEMNRVRRRARKVLKKLGLT